MLSVNGNRPLSKLKTSSSFATSGTFNGSRSVNFSKDGDTRGLSSQHKKMNGSRIEGHHSLSTSKSVKSKKGGLNQAFIKPSSKKIRLKDLSGLHRFQEAVKTVMGKMKAISPFAHLFNNVATEEDDALDIEEQDFGGVTYNGLVFNVNDFKAKRTDLLTTQTKDILKKPKDTRSSLDIDIILEFVKRMKSFERYSMSMKRELCKIMIYEAFGRDRVIVKQGHPAYAFYFIVKGACVVTREEEDEYTKVKNVRVLSELKAGDVFGEIALTKDVNRTATITTVKKCEFLKVMKEDFQNLLKQNFEQSVMKRMNLLQNIPIFSKLTEQKINQIAGLCRSSEFPPYTTIVSEGKSTSEMYFVSDGVCKVLKRVKMIGSVSKGRYMDKWNYRPLDEDQNLAQNEHIVEKVMRIAEIRGNEFFGEDNIFLTDRRSAMSDCFKGILAKSEWTIETVTKMECLVIGKVDLLRAISIDEYNDIKSLYNTYPPMPFIIEKFMEQTDWSNYKKEYIAEIVSKKREQRNRPYSAWN